MSEPSFPHGGGAIIVTKHERDTIMAALRYWQRVGMGGSIGPEWDIAENGRVGDAAALNADEIDNLCERINA